MNRRRNPWSELSALTLCLCTLATSCAHQPPKRRVGVNIESRPTPQPPDSAGVAPAETAETGAAPRPVVMSNETRRVTRAGLAADTTAARAALERCAGRKLLPDQDGVFEATTRALMDVRAALAAGDLSHAESLARQAKQLASSLVCR